MDGRDGRDTGGPERGAKRQSAERVGLGRGAVARPQYVNSLRKNCQNINVEIAHFYAFCKLRWSHVQCRPI